MKNNSSLFLFIALFFIIALLQESTFSIISVFGVKPDILLAMSAMIAFYVSGIFLPLASAFIAGVFAGFYSDAPLGFYVVLYSGTCFLIFFCRKQRFAFTEYAPLIVSLTATIFSIIFYLIYFFITQDLSDFYFFAKTFSIYAVLNLIISFPIAWFVKIFSAPRNKLFWNG